MPRLKITPVLSCFATRLRRESSPSDHREGRTAAFGRIGTTPLFQADEKMSIQTTAYDTVPYPGHALAQAHPDRLATIATLFGMKPAEVNRSRLLDFGRGAGLILASVALSFADARSIGLV